MSRQDKVFGYEAMNNLEITTAFLHDITETKSLAILNTPDRGEGPRAEMIAPASGHHPASRVDISCLNTKSYAI